MNLSIWDIMGPAFIELLILVGIHSYLGLHVIRRKVIFVDLALAQIAALGTTVGFLFGIIPGSTGSYWFSLGFTFIGAAVFSISRIRNEKIPQEAVIGLAYAIAASVSILVIDKAPHGAEHIKEILTGAILWVKWSTIRNAAIVYSLVGIFHFIFRKQFILISENPEKAYNSNMNIRFWDFLFYISFGIVITHSVGTAGVLLVFVFLIVPAITSMLITDVLWKQLTIGWAMGVTVSIIGLYISYIADLPSGPTVVALYGLMLVAVALVIYIKSADSRSSALIKIALGLGITLMVIWGFYILGESFQGDHDHEVYENTHQEEIADSVQLNFNDFDSISGDELDEALKSIADIKILKQIFAEQKDEYYKSRIAIRASEINKKEGAFLLINVLSSGKLPFVLEEVYSRLIELSNRDFGYDTMNSPEENKSALEKAKSWVESL